MAAIYHARSLFREEGERTGATPEGTARSSLSAMRASPRVVARSVLLAAMLLSPTFAACNGHQATAHGPVRPVSEWTGDEADLFDDGVDVGAFPLPGASEGHDDRNDGKIPNRVDTADGVVIAKVIGVSSEPVGDKNRYRLELVIEGDPLAGAKPDSPFTLKIEPGTPAFGTVRSQEGQLIGKRLVVYFRRYANEEGGDEPITHFHLSPSSERVLGLIRSHATRKKVQGS
jgi:hypothetical protein